MKYLLLLLALTSVPQLALSVDREDSEEEPEALFEELVDDAGGMSLEQAAQKSNNPVSDAWLLITQNDYTVVDTPEGSDWRNSTTMQPVLPVPIPVASGTWLTGS